jgi:hypothetical protein
MVAFINVGSDERSCFGISSGNSKTHDIELKPNGNKTVDVLLHWHQYLARHVPALFGPWRLVLNVNSGCPFLDEHLGELHDGSETSVTGICIGNNRV